VTRAPAEAAVARKVRRHLLPPLFLLYVDAFLDRLNVGFVHSLRGSRKIFRAVSESSSARE
jgi:hypothetical protein